MATLRGLNVRIEGGFYYFGSRKYHREACPLSLRSEIEKAVAAADPKQTKRAKNASNTQGRANVSARATQRKVYRKG